MKRRTILVVLLMTCMLLQGCGLRLRGSGEPTQTGSRMVTQISVNSVPEDAEAARIYTEPTKIQAILNYLEDLKLIERRSTGSDPYGGATRTITIQYSGGGSKVYYLVKEEFLREGDNSWMYVEEEPEVSLTEILQKYGSDVTVE